MVERLVGMQAQVPENPYVALWSRIEDFDPHELSDLIAERRAVRAHAMRSTIHLLSARDCLAIQPLTQDVLIRGFSKARRREMGGADPHAVAAAGLELLREQPLTRAELSRLLADRWPGAEPQHPGYAVTTHTRLVHVPPRGLWPGGSRVAFAPSDDWLAQHEPTTTTVDELVLRYLAAFGPATPADARTWSGLTGLREVFERLRPQLRTFRDERGRELFDVPDAPVPDPDTPAPPRFLPEYDNVALSHDGRSRIIGPGWPGQPPPGQRWIGSLLVDGFYRGRWRITADGELRIEGLEPTPEIEAEGERLLALVALSSAAR